MNQINAHGDPLLQEYVYHDGQRVKAAAGIKNNEIFTQNINSLTGKTQLRLWMIMASLIICDNKIDGEVWVRWVEESESGTN